MKNKLSKILEMISEKTDLDDDTRKNLIEKLFNGSIGEKNNAIKQLIDIMSAMTDDELAIGLLIILISYAYSDIGKGTKAPQIVTKSFEDLKRKSKIEYYKQNDRNIKPTRESVLFPKEAYNRPTRESVLFPKGLITFTFISRINLMKLPFKITIDKRRTDELIKQVNLGKGLPTREELEMDIRYPKFNDEPIPYDLRQGKIDSYDNELMVWLEEGREIAKGFIECCNEYRELLQGYISDLDEYRRKELHL